MRRFASVVWWGTRVEVCSALCRLRRANVISAEEWREGKAKMEGLTRSWREILPGEELWESAERLLEKHALKAGDSLQLAAALVWCGGRAARRVFLSGDEKLSEVTRAEGFAVVEIG